MKRILFFLIVTIAVGDVWAQNNFSSQGRRERAKPERALVKRTNIPVKNIHAPGKWIDFAVPFDEKNLSDSKIIEISSAKQLAYLAKQVNSGINYSGIHFKLVAHINLSGLEWIPVGLFGEDLDDNSSRFCGFFDGNGHKIENLTIANGGDHSGLFGVCGTGAYINNLHIAGCYVRGNIAVGGLVGELIKGTVAACSVSGTVIANDECAGGLVGMNNGTITGSRSSAEVFGYITDTGGLAGVNGERMPAVIDSCEATGAITGFFNVGGLVGRNYSAISKSRASGDVIGEEWVGGLVGWSNEGIITFCQASGNVKGFVDVGGLAGFGGHVGTTSKIIHSHATGNVTGAGLGSNCVGGLAGYSGGFITDCYASGAVIGDEATGGLIGEHGGVIFNSFATGNVSGCFDVGGLVGYHGYPGSRTLLENCYATGTVTGIGVNSYGIGGLAGYSGSKIVNCYASGAVSGRNVAGGLVGEQKGTITNCYASGEVKAIYTAGGLVGRNFSTINNCYYDRDTTKQKKGAGKNNNEKNCSITPLTTKQFHTGSKPAGFDEKVWVSVVGQYPKLVIR